MPCVSAVTSGLKVLTDARKKHSHTRPFRRGRGMAPPGHDRNEVYHVPRGAAYEAVASLVRVHCERGIGVFMGREQAACDAQVPARFQMEA